LFQGNPFLAASLCQSLHSFTIVFLDLCFSLCFLRVYSKYPELLAEMYAYSMAAAHTNLPHLTMLNYMVSNVDMDEEGWKYIDEFGDDVCDEPVNGVFYPGFPLPTVLHFCQFYRSAEIGFQKRRMKKAIFECDKPLLAALPQSQGKNRYKNRDGEVRSFMFLFLFFFMSFLSLWCLQLFEFRS
jgi:hypothetical protein